MTKMSDASQLKQRGAESLRQSHGSFAVEGWKEIDGLPQGQEYHAGIQLLQQGSLPQEVYLISSGLVKLIYSGEEGQEVIVGLRYPGWALGAAAVILQEPSPVAATTLTRCQLHCIPAKDFLHLLETNVQFSLQVHMIHSREVYDQVARLIGLASLSARQRLEQLFWELTAAQETKGRQKEIKLQLPLKQWEIADLLAITPSYLSRLLKQLERDGIIRRRKGWIIVSDPQKLWHTSDS